METHAPSIKVPADVPGDPFSSLVGLSDPSNFNAAKPSGRFTEFSSGTSPSAPEIPSHTLQLIQPTQVGTESPRTLAPAGQERLSTGEDPTARTSIDDDLEVVQNTLGQSLATPVLSAAESPREWEAPVLSTPPSILPQKVVTSTPGQLKSASPAPANNTKPRQVTPEAPRQNSSEGPPNVAFTPTIQASPVQSAPVPTPDQNLLNASDSPSSSSVQIGGAITSFVSAEGDQPAPSMKRGSKGITSLPAQTFDSPVASLSGKENTPTEPAQVAVVLEASSVNNDAEQAEFHAILDKFSNVDVKMSASVAPPAATSTARHPVVPPSVTLPSSVTDPLAASAIPQGNFIPAAGSKPINIPTNNESKIKARVAPESTLDHAEPRNSAAEVAVTIPPAPNGSGPSASTPEENSPFTPQPQFRERQQTADASSAQPNPTPTSGDVQPLAEANPAATDVGGRAVESKDDNSAPASKTSPAGTPATILPDPAAGALPAPTPVVVTIHADKPAPPATPPPQQPAAALSAWQNYDGGGGRIVQSASMHESAGMAEMHVEFRSGPLGPMQLHTIVSEGSVGAEIHVQGQEAHTLLAAGLPSLESSLSARNLHVQSITVHQDGIAGGMSGFGREGSPSDSPPPPRPPARNWNNSPLPGTAASESPVNQESDELTAGLSIRA